MKKLLTWGFALFMLAGMISSCSKYDDDTNGLKGTTWTWTSGDNSETLVFTAGSTVAVTGRTGGISYSLSATYTYKKPNVVILLDNGNTLSGTVSASIMLLTFDGGDALSYNKR
jgi:hypothetical protein